MTSRLRWPLAIVHFVVQSLNPTEILNRPFQLFWAAHFYSTPEPFIFDLSSTSEAGKPSPIRIVHFDSLLRPRANKLLSHGHPGQDLDHSQIKFEKANLVVSRHDYSNVKLRIRPEFWKWTIVRYQLYPSKFDHRPLTSDKGIANFAVFDNSNVDPLADGIYETQIRIDDTEQTISKVRDSKTMYRKRISRSKELNIKSQIAGITGIIIWRAFTGTRTANLFKLTGKTME